MARINMINRINKVIAFLGKDELISKFKEKYPKLEPNKKAQIYYLRWPKVNAGKLENNGKYRKI